MMEDGLILKSMILTGTKCSYPCRGKLRAFMFMTVMPGTVRPFFTRRATFSDPYPPSRKFDDYDQTFINDELIGKTGSGSNGQINLNDDLAYSKVRKYALPTAYLKFGAYNTIAVRVYDKFIDGGMYEGPIGIIKQEAYTDFWRSWWR